jgi:hypothetical protein
VKVLDIPLALHPGEGIGCGGMATIRGVGTRFDGSTLLFGRLCRRAGFKGYVALLEGYCTP